jgi:hypothetical protein
MTRPKGFGPRRQETLGMQQKAITSLARALLEQNSAGYQLHVAYRDSFPWDEWPGLRSACQQLAEDCGCTLSDHDGSWVLEKTVHRAFFHATAVG